MPTQDIEKINSRDFGGFNNMGATVHNDDVANNKKMFNGVSDKLEVGQLQRQYTRGGKRSSHSLMKQEQHNRVGE